MRCDLHVHSRVSDGWLAPAALVEEAARCGVDVLALTDHDEVAGIAEARERGTQIGVEVLAGIEISVSDPPREMHVLGLGIDPRYAPLRAWVAQMRGSRLRRAEAMLERLRALGIDIDLARVERLAQGGVIGRAHLARALVECGAVRSEQQAFARYLRRGRPAHVAREGLALAEATALIHAAGGLAVLAHPPRSPGADGPGGLLAFVERAARAGLDGIEVQHPGHSPAQVRKLRRLCRELGLLETGGSDFHGGADADIRPGHGRNSALRVGQRTWDELRARLEKRSSLTHLEQVSKLGGSSA